MMILLSVFVTQPLVLIKGVDLLKLDHVPESVFLFVTKKPLWSQRKTVNGVCKFFARGHLVKSKK
jgi:hypothetical protein